AGSQQVASMRLILLLLVTVLAAQGCTPAQVTPARVAQATYSPPPVRHAPFKGKVASFRITNDNPGALTERVVSFGQILRQGQVDADNRLIVQLDGKTVAAEMNAKAFYPDGSVKHAIIALRMPKLDADASTKGVI